MVNWKPKVRVGPTGAAKILLAIRLGGSHVAATLSHTFGF